MTRFALRVPDVLKNRFSGEAHSSKMEELVRAVADANVGVVKRALKSTGSQGQAKAGTPGPTPLPGGQGSARTGCQPAFSDGDQPLDPCRMVDLATIPDTDFASTVEWLGI